MFTLGSAAVNTAGSFFDESAKAVATLGRPRGAGGRPQSRQPPGVPATGAIAVDGAPHDQVFPRASVVVHQGGVGTTGQAMRSGRPELIVPFAHDQPDNAFRVQQLGVARVVYPRRYQAARVAASWRHCSSDTLAAAAADAVGQRVRAEGGAPRQPMPILACLPTARL